MNRTSFTNNYIMNTLPEDVLDTIYKCKHQIEYAKIMGERIQHKINCRHNVTIGMLIYMFYLNDEGLQVSSIDASSIEVFAFEILNIITSRTYFDSI